MEIPELKKLRRAYGFDEVAIVPGSVTVNPDQTNVSLQIDEFEFPIPFMASSLDAVVSPEFAISLGKMGGLGVLNLEGIYTRHEDAESVIKEITQASQEEATPLLQKIYSTPIKENLIGDRIELIKKGRSLLCHIPNTCQYQKIGTYSGGGWSGHIVHTIDSDYCTPH